MISNVFRRFKPLSPKFVQLVRNKVQTMFVNLLNGVFFLTSAETVMAFRLKVRESTLCQEEHISNCLNLTE